MTDQSEPKADVCCGEHKREGKGGPFVSACVLCSKSPSYWRDEPGARGRLAGNPRRPFGP